MIVQHNMTALNANRQLGITNSALAKSTEKLSSGYRVNRAADDAAGLSISEKMRGQIRGLNQASDNAENGISLIQTAEGALNEIHSVLQRMRELTVQAANDTNVTADRQAIALELSQLTNEIDRIASQTQYNTMNLLNGSFTKKHLQVGANTNQMISIKIAAMTAKGLGVAKSIIARAVYVKGNKAKDVAASDETIAGTKYDYKGSVKGVGGKAITGSTISKLIDRVNSALTQVSLQRSYLGAIQNRLEHTVTNADNMAENLQSAESQIRDVNMADEMVTYSAKSILQQAGQSMLAQANQATQGVLSLLR